MNTTEVPKITRTNNTPGKVPVSVVIAVDLEVIDCAFWINYCSNLTIESFKIGKIPIVNHIAQLFEAFL